LEKKELNIPRLDPYFPPFVATRRAVAPGKVNGDIADMSSRHYMDSNAVRDGEILEDDQSVWNNST
jgi:hypothetical protein